MRLPKTIHECIDRIRTVHFPRKALSKEELQAKWDRLPWSVPSDLRVFYEHCNGALLFRTNDPPFEILPVDAFHSVRIDITGEDDDKWAPAAWHSIAFVQDSNYIAVDLDSVNGDSAEFLDCFHETLGIEGYQKVIAKSFTEFLCDALASEGRQYWLDRDFSGYGYR